MDIGEMKVEMDRRFTEMDTRFEQVDRRFEQVDQRFDQIDQRFELVDQRFEQIDQRFEQVDQRFLALEQQISAEGVATRRHFDIVTEKLIGERNLALDQSQAASERVTRLTASNAADHVAIENRLDDHERRISELEKK